MTCFNSRTNAYQLISGAKDISGFATQMNAPTLSQFNIWAIWGDAAFITVTFKDTHDADSVSYTHLDVYKRQEHDRRHHDGS